MERKKDAGKHSYPSIEAVVAVPKFDSDSDLVLVIAAAAADSDSEVMQMPELRKVFEAIDQKAA